MRYLLLALRTCRKPVGFFCISLLVLGLLTNSHALAANSRAPASVHTPPNPPSNLAVVATGTTSTNLQWADNSEDEDGFWLERSPDGVANWTQLDTVAPNVMTFDNSGLACGTAFFYRVGAFNNDGNSDYSNVASATTGACVTVNGTTNIYMPSVSKPALVTQAARLVDVTVSLYNAPAADGRAIFEGIIRYFADGVYEMTNGAHKIRRVTIFTNGQNADQANIIWKAAGQCWPNATISGYTTKGARIEMCDANSSGEPYATANDADQQNGGYTTAHEWGHFFYGISDEYKGDPNAQAFGSLGPLPGDVEVENSVMTQQRNAILGTTSQGRTYNGNFNWLNFDTQLNNTRNNSQFRLYETSGWDTLARPATADPRGGERDNYNPRDAYPELATFAPAAGQSPSIELPAGRTSARSELQIVWPNTLQIRGARAQAGDGVARQIVIESSTSMANSDKLEQVKAAAKQMVESAEVGDTLGILHFDGVVTTTFPLTVIASQATKDAMETAIDAIAIGHSPTAMGDALQVALDGFNSAGILSDTLRAVYLIVDSSSTAGRNPLTVVQNYANTFVPLYTFGFGTGQNASGVLTQLAEQTDGEFYFVSNATELLDALGEAGELSSPEVDADIAQGAATVAAATTLDVPFHVDASVGNLEVEVAYTGSPLSATVALLDPVGTPNPNGTCEVSSFDSGPETYCRFVVDSPSAGAWRLHTVATDTIDLAYSVVGASLPNTYTFSTAIESVNGDVLIAPTKLVVRAEVQKEWPITDLAISGTVELPDGTEQGVTLRDDGVAPDTLAQDGIYMTDIAYADDGDYFITVRFHNHANTAKNTQYSINLDGGPDGIQPPYRAPWLLGEDFERVATLQISVVK